MHKSNKSYSPTTKTTTTWTLEHEGCRLHGEGRVKITILHDCIVKVGKKTTFWVFSNFYFQPTMKPSIWISLCMHMSQWQKKAIWLSKMDWLDMCIPDGWVIQGALSLNGGSCEGRTKLLLLWINERQKQINTAKHKRQQAGKCFLTST